VYYYYELSYCDRDRSEGSRVFPKIKLKPLQETECDAELLGRYFFVRGARFKRRVRPGPSVSLEIDLIGFDCRFDYHSYYYSTIVYTMCDHIW